MSDDDRTTPLGLFNYARSYWQSGVLLHDASAKVTHPDAPVIGDVDSQHTKATRATTGATAAAKATDATSTKTSFVCTQM
jgi:hypothetical protein